jgi:hypothetical protein
MKYTFLERDLKKQIINSDIKGWKKLNSSSFEFSDKEKSESDEDHGDDYHVFRPTFKN